MDIKDKLKEKRMEAGLTQKELAEILHVSRQTVSSWEVGRTYPDLDILIAMSDLYETLLDDLLKEDSRMVEDITKKVKSSQRRKTVNLVFAALLAFIIGWSAINWYHSYENQKTNEAGISANDLLNTTWSLNFDANQELKGSYISFGNKDMLIFNQYEDSLITPDVIPETIHKKQAEWEEKGLADGLYKYKDLKITLEGNKYILTAYGYYQEFTRISDTIIESGDDIEYYLQQPNSSHKTLRWLAKETDTPVKDQK